MPAASATKSQVPNLTSEDRAEAQRQAADNAEREQNANEWVAQMSLMLHDVIEMASADTGYSNDSFWMRFGHKGPELKQGRESSGWNGYVRIRTEMKNSMLDPGEKVTAIDVSRDPETTASWNALSRAEQDEYKTMQTEWRDEKNASQLKYSPKAAAQNTTRVLNGIVNVCHRLFQRNNIACAIFAAKASNESCSLPFFWATEKVRDFFPTAFRKSGCTIAGLMEGHALNGAEGLASHSLSASKRLTRDRTEVRELTIESLAEATGKPVDEIKSRRFSYKHFFPQVMGAYLVKLVKYPLKEILDPSDIRTDDLRTLLKALRDGSCHFEKITASEFKKLEAEMVRMKAAGLPPLPFHKDENPKKRSKKRKNADADNNDENEAEAEVGAEAEDIGSAGGGEDADGEVDEDVAPVVKSAAKHRASQDVDKAKSSKSQPQKNGPRPQKKRKVTEQPNIDAQVFRPISTQPTIHPPTDGVVDGPQAQPASITAPSMLPHAHTLLHEPSSLHASQHPAHSHLTPSFPPYLPSHTIAQPWAPIITYDINPAYPVAQDTIGQATSDYGPVQATSNPAMYLVPTDINRPIDPNYLHEGGTWGANDTPYNYRLTDAGESAPAATSILDDIDFTTLSDPSLNLTLSQENAVAQFGDFE